MFNEILKWILSVATSTGVITLALYLMRGTLIRIFTKKIEHHFEKKLETFKADIRESEKELEQIRSFIVSSRRDRDVALQVKRFEAAESMMRARKSLSEFSILVEYMKGLNIDEILKKGDDPKIIEFINALLKPLNIDEKISSYSLFDKSHLNLYLSEKTIKVFDAYEMIILHSVTMMRLLSMPLKNKDHLINKGDISKFVIEAAPTSKEGFEKFGEDYALHWANYFYNEILKSLRKELHGAENMERDTESATRLALDSRKAQLTMRSTLDAVGLSDALLKPVDNK